MICSPFVCIDYSYYVTKFNYVALHQAYIYATQHFYVTGTLGLLKSLHAMSSIEHKKVLILPSILQ